MTPVEIIPPEEEAFARPQTLESDTPVTALQGGVAGSAQRVLQGAPAAVSVSWERDGGPVDPGDPVTVTITRADLTVLASSVTATGGPGSSRQISLTPAQTSTLDYLTLVWSAADGSVMTSYVDVVGGFLFSIAHARLRSPLQDTTTYPTQVLLDYRAYAEEALESICGVAFVPRFSREKVSITGYGLLTTSKRRIRTVRQISTFMSGNQVPLPTLAGLQVVGSDQIYMPTLWNFYSLPIYCNYEHGFDSPPARAGRAAMELARRWIVESPWDERATGFRTREGGQMSILTASHSDPFDIPEVVAVCDAYGTPLVA